MKARKYFGETLVDRGIVAPEDINNALEQQRKCGSKIGKILVSSGKINNYILSKHYAEYANQDFVDLMDTPCDATLIDANRRELYNHLGIIPWRRDQHGVIIFAVSDPTPKILMWLDINYDRYRYVITSPNDIHYTLSNIFSFENNDKAINSLYNRFPKLSAKHTISPQATQVFIFFAISILAVFVLSPKGTLLTAYWIANGLYIISMLFKIFLFSKGKASVDQYKVEELNIPDKNLPVYSILVPLYKEKEVVPQLINAIRKLDYPKSKLDVKLIVEHDDVETIVAIKNLRCERYFHIIEVPFSEPRTKPKACNYAMNFVLGEYVTIYDAEDIPDSQQLKKVINIFCQSDHKTICVQAKLNYYNWSANWLTKLFAIEYSVWFDVVMYGLSGLKMPIPLGGTSNHFNVHKLKQIGCWDPYNVTEDADLGIRIAANNYEIKLVDSTTQEGAPTKFINWYKQRSRWLKGYMQTYLVHMRQPNKLIKNIGIQGFLGFQLFIGLPIIIYLISWPLIIVSIISSVFNIVEFPISLLYIAWVNLFAGYIMMLSMAMKARKYRKFSKITTMTLIYPLFYAVILPLVSIRSLYQLITTPHYWEKTSHAESLRHNDI